MVRKGEGWAMTSLWEFPLGIFHFSFQLRLKGSILSHTRQVDGIYAQDPNVRCPNRRNRLTRGGRRRKTKTAEVNTKLSHQFTLGWRYRLSMTLKACPKQFIIDSKPSTSARFRFNEKPILPSPRLSAYRFFLFF